jgi:probable phosphoglycerate mutase
MTASQKLLQLYFIRHGETARAERLIAQLQGLEGAVALFSHRQFGCALAARWIGAPVIEGQHFALGPASLSILGHEARRPGTRVIELWNAAPASRGAE